MVPVLTASWEMNIKGKTSFKAMHKSYDRKNEKVERPLVPDRVRENFPG